jgi:hypothetical protein
MHKQFLLSLCMLPLLSACAYMSVFLTSNEPVKVVQAGPLTQLPAPQYEPLIYGKPKPLVCTRPYMPKGQLSTRPNLQLMWENYLYPRPEGIWSEVGGMVEKNGTLPFDKGRWVNACTVRFSHMLNKAGHKIKRLPGETVSGRTGDQYFFRFADLEVYLNETFGAPDLEINDGTANSFDLPITPGIVLLDLPDGGYTGHATVWNGAGTVDGANIGGYRVLFWNLPCYVPKGRTSPLAEMIPEQSSLSFAALTSNETVEDTQTFCELPEG